MTCLSSCLAVPAPHALPLPTDLTCLLACLAWLRAFAAMPALPSPADRAYPALSALSWSWSLFWSWFLTCRDYPPGLHGLPAVLVLPIVPAPPALPSLIAMPALPLENSSRHIWSRPLPKSFLQDCNHCAILVLKLCSFISGAGPGLILICCRVLEIVPA